MRLRKRIGSHWARRQPPLLSLRFVKDFGSSGMSWGLRMSDLGVRLGLSEAPVEPSRAISGALALPPPP
eukprot:9258217-Pyramimonas_sp.AAC.1